MSNPVYAVEFDPNSVATPDAADPISLSDPGANAGAKIVNRDNMAKPALMLALVLLVFIAFANSLSGDLVYDDLSQIRDNPTLGHLDWATVKQVFTRDLWASIRPQVAGDNIISLYYRPVFNLFLMIGYGLVGHSPLGWHLLVVLLHTLAVVLVFLTLEKSLAAVSDFEAKDRRLLAALAAGVFAVHPVQSESIAWISGSVSPLSTAFSLGAFYCYLVYRESKRGSRTMFVASAGAVIFFSLAVLAKESAVALVLIVASYELLFAELGMRGAERIRRATLRVLPFAFVAVGYLALRYSILGILFSGKNVNANFPDDASLTMLDTLLTLPNLLLGYIRLAVFPFDLSFVYSISYVRSVNLGSFWVPLFIVSAVLVFLTYLSRRMPEIKLAIIWMAIPLLPHLNTRVFASEAIMQDRYLYLSMVGFGLIVASPILRTKRARRLRLPAPVLAAIPVIALMGLCSLTIAQNRQWKSEESLWTSAAAKSPNSRVVQMALGALAEAKQDPEGALRKYEAALLIHPDIVDALNNSAFIYARQGQWAEATYNFERIVSLTPWKAIAHFNLSFAYAVQKRYADAAREQLAAIELEPSNPRADEWRYRLDQLEKELAYSRQQGHAQFINGSAAQ